jgi:cytochrome c-type biogenesis protein CcmF
MAQIGSFVLLLALASSAYCVVAGIIAIVGKRAFAAPLGETVRRDGIASFALVLLAALILVVAAFENDFSIACVFHHSNRDLPAPYKFATLRSGQEGSSLFWALR